MLSSNTYVNTNFLRTHGPVIPYLRQLVGRQMRHPGHYEQHADDLGRADQRAVGQLQSLQQLAAPDEVLLLLLLRQLRQLRPLDPEGAGEGGEGPVRQLLAAVGRQMREAGAVLAQLEHHLVRADAAQVHALQVRQAAEKKSRLGESLG